MASAMCSWLHEIVTLLDKWWWLVSHHHLLVTLAICLWLQVMSLTTTTISTWSNITWSNVIWSHIIRSRHHLPSNVTNVNNVTLLCKSRAHYRCQCFTYKWKMFFMSHSIIITFFVKAAITFTLMLETYIWPKCYLSLVFDFPSICFTSSELLLTR